MTARVIAIRTRGRDLSRDLSASLEWLTEKRRLEALFPGATVVDPRTLPTEPQLTAIHEQLSTHLGTYTLH